MAPAARSPILRNDIRPDDLPPPDSRSPSPRSAREVGAGARAVLEEARLADPEVHDAAFVHQVVGDALDEAGVRLRPLVGGVGGMGDAVAMIDVPMALARTVDAVGPVQAGVEPLRRVGRADLRRQHEAMLVVEGAGVGLAVEVAALPAPVGPGAGHAMEDLAGAASRRRSAASSAARRAPPRRAPSATAIRARRARRPCSGARARRRGGNTFAPARRSRPATTPAGTSMPRMLEDDRAVGIADFGIASTERHSFEWRSSCLRKPTLQAHRRSPVPSSRRSIPCAGCSSR